MKTAAYDYCSACCWHRRHQPGGYPGYCPECHLPSVYWAGEETLYARLFTRLDAAEEKAGERGRANA